MSSSSQEAHRIRARQSGPLDARRIGQLTGDQLLLWRQIGRGGATIAELTNGGTSQESLKNLRDLRDLGAISFERSEGDDDDIPIYDETELEELSSGEERLLAETVDLEPWEKRRILAVVRAVELGEYYEVLRLPRGASRGQLKAAYYELSKQYHPDRYFGPAISAVSAPSSSASSRRPRSL